MGLNEETGLPNLKRMKSIQGNSFRFCLLCRRKLQLILSGQYHQHLCKDQMLVPWVDLGETWPFMGLKYWDPCPS